MRGRGLSRSPQHEETYTSQISRGPATPPPNSISVPGISEAADPQGGAAWLHVGW